MIRTIAFALFAALFPLVAVHAGTAGQCPVNLILDTDIGPDYDDVGAMALMHALADNGEAKILATVACNTDARVVPCIKVINGWYGRKDIPVGAPKGYSAPRLTTSMLRTDWPGYLVSHFAHATDSTACAPSAVETYRRVLSRQPDGSVTICTLGFFSNLKALLASGPDRWSKLSGKDLVAKKVKLLVSMAGAFPNGYEFNVYLDADAARTVADEWPTPIIFSGWEIGSEIFTGNAVRDLPGDISANPIKAAYTLALSEDDRPHGRDSWDQTAALVAIRGAAPWFTLRHGHMKVDGKGNNKWTDDPQGQHAYLVFAQPIKQVRDAIEALMTQMPRKR